MRLVTFLQPEFLAEHLFAPIEAISIHPPDPARRMGVWGVVTATLACEWGQNSPPVQRMQGFPCLGAERNRPKALCPAVKRQMPLPRVHSAR